MSAAKKEAEGEKGRLLGYRGLEEIGPLPRVHNMGRWARWSQVDLAGLPPVKEYECRRTDTPIVVDGRLDEAVWQRAQWSGRFGRISDGADVELQTQVALLWDREYLYAGYRVEDPDIRGSMTGFHDHVYINDEDVEIFVEGEGHYYELGVNPLNNIYELHWTWVEPLVRTQGFQALQELFKAPDYLYYVAREGEPIGRHGDLNWQLPGLKHAVSIDGSLNNPGVKDKGWTVEFALPWEGLRAISGGRPLPPTDGEVLRVTAYRAHHYRRADGTSHSEGWTWSIMGNDNIHIPERWARVRFVDRPV